LEDALRTSESDAFTVKDAIAGFEQELLDDCFDRSLARLHTRGRVEEVLKKSQEEIRIK